MKNNNHKNEPTSIFLESILGTVQRLDQEAKENEKKLQQTFATKKLQMSDFKKILSESIEKSEQSIKDNPEQRKISFDFD